MNNQITITISGPEGIGKSMIGCALAQALLESNHAVEVTDDVGTPGVVPTQLDAASIKATAYNYFDYVGDRNPVKIVIGVSP